MLTIEDSTVDANSSVVESSVPGPFPADVEQEADAGGIRVTEAPGSSATITNSSDSWNTVSSTNSAGDVQATNGGIDDDGSLLLVGSRVDHNQVTGRVPASSGFLAGAVDGGLQVQGVATIPDSSISHNSSPPTARQERRTLQEAGSAASAAS